MKSYVRWGAALTLSAVLAGCGGGSGGVFSPTPTPNATATATPGAVLTGKTAIRAVMTSGYQTYQASINYPFSGLQLALPPSSPFKRTQKLAGHKLAATLQFSEALGLYFTTSTSGNTTTIRYYTDAAGTKSAGTSTLVAPGGSIVGTNYASYPVVIQIRQNVTGGNIPCIGSGTITISDGRGKNTIEGTLNLPKTGLKVTANLTLSDEGNVGGTASIVGNGQTIALSNLSGPLFNDLTANVRVSPDGDTGTATLNLFTGKFVVNLQTKEGTATSSSDSSGALSITFPDKVGERLLDPLLIVGGEDPDSPTPTPRPTTRPTSPTATPRPTTQPTSAPLYKAPVELVTGDEKTRFFIPVALNNKNQILGTTGSINGYQNVFFPGPTATPQTFSYSTLTAIALNNNGAILGNSILGDISVAYYRSASSPIQSLSNDHDVLGASLNDKGAIVGRSLYAGSDGFSRSNGLYWSSFTAAPLTLKVPPGDDLIVPMFINSQGQIVGTSGKAATAAITPVFWSSSTATPQKMQRFGLDPISTVKINAQGKVLVSNGTESAYYPTVTSSPVTLPTLPGGERLGNSGGAKDINASGVVVGTSYNSSGQRRAVRWVNGQPQDLNNLIPAGSPITLESASAINDSGAVIGEGSLKNGTPARFYLAPR